jgi:hypothetical protein
LEIARANAVEGPPTVAWLATHSVSISIFLQRPVPNTTRAWMATRMTRKRKKTGPWPTSVERTVPTTRTAKKRCRRKFLNSSLPLRRFTGVKAARRASAVYHRSIGTSKPKRLVTPVEISSARANTVKTTAAR